MLGEARAVLRLPVTERASVIEFVLSARTTT